jgi:hypothetical protein
MYLDDNLLLLMEHCMKFQHFSYINFLTRFNFPKGCGVVRSVTGFTKADLLRCVQGLLVVAFVSSCCRMWIVMIVL